MAKKTNKALFIERSLKLAGELRQSLDPWEREHESNAASRFPDFGSDLLTGRMRAGTLCKEMSDFGQLVFDAGRLEVIEKWRQQALRARESLDAILEPRVGLMSEPLLSDAALRRIKKSRRLALALSRSLTALQLADEHSPPKNAPSQPSEADRGSQRRRPIPRQVAAPIMTDIDDNRLVSVPGPPVATSEAERYKSEYLAKQLHSIIAALRSSSNQSKSVIAAFSEARALLEGWSTARLLAFGAHLHLLEKYAVGVREEVMDDTRHQLDAWLDNARQFVTSFDEWHAYMEKPIARAERVTEVTQPVREVVEQAAQALGRESDAVEQRIPVQLNEWRDLMAAGNARRTRLVGAVSSLRSMLNISISFVRYRTAMAARGVGELVRHPRVQAVLRTMCAFLPLATKLAPLHPEFAFLVERKEELRMWCEGLKNAKAI